MLLRLQQGGLNCCHATTQAARQAPVTAFLINSKLKYALRPVTHSEGASQRTHISYDQVKLQAVVQNLHQTRQRDSSAAVLLRRKKCGSGCHLRLGLQHGQLNFNAEASTTTDNTSLRAGGTCNPRSTSPTVSTTTSISSPRQGIGVLT